MPVDGVAGRLMVTLVSSGLAWGPLLLIAMTVTASAGALCWHLLRAPRTTWAEPAGHVG